jgi:dynein heavy chain
VLAFAETNGATNLLTQTVQQDGSAAKVTPELVHKPCFFFALIWSVGASCDLKGRRKFNDFLLSLMEERGHSKEMSQNSNVYGSCLFAQFRAWEWTEWIETIPPFKLDPKTPFGSILVPTTDTIRYSHLVALLVNNNKHVLGVGNTGLSRCLYLRVHSIGVQVLPMCILTAFTCVE